MPIYHNHKPNPNHHNYGREQNFNQRLTRRLSFINFTAQGLSGNLSSAASELRRSIAEPEFRLLSDLDQLRITDFIRQLQNMQGMLRDLAEDVAEYNRDKPRLELGQKKSPKQRA